jgi:hypothetical protein
LGELNGQLKELLGTSLTPSGADLSRLKELSPQRNLLVHKRGKVDDVYKGRVPSSFDRTGEDLPISYVDIVTAAKLLSRSVRHLEEQVIREVPDLVRRRRTTVKASPFPSAATPFSRSGGKSQAATS